MRKNKALAWIVSIVGVFLIISGIAASSEYLELGLLDFFGGEMLVSELSITGGIFLGLFGGGLCLFHGVNSIRNRKSNPIRLPRFYIIYLGFALVLGLGNLLLVGLDNGTMDEGLVSFTFPPIFILGASLPVLAALAFAFRRLGWPVSWRQVSLMFVSGGTLSILVTMIFAGTMRVAYFLLIVPLQYFAESALSTITLGGTNFFERLFTSPLLVFYLLYIAFQAPFPEEAAKALGPGMMGKRIKNERAAFAIGMASGAGFAVLENMRYQGLFAQLAGWTWGGITALRGIGAIDHALWTGIIVLALYRERAREPGWFGRLRRAYLFSVGLHTLWNGGYMALLYLLGLDYYTDAGSSFSVYGEYLEISLIVILVAMTVLNWWIMIRYLNRLQAEEVTAIERFKLSPRAIAVWALACVVVIVPLGAALGQAWDEIKAVF